MTDRKQALKDLRDKVAAGDGMGAGIIARSMASEARDAGRLFPAHDIHKAFYGSLDAAKALHDAVLPGLIWVTLIDGYGATIGVDGEEYTGHSADMARAWLSAVLSALVAKEETT